jgi:hypothetical protein
VARKQGLRGTGAIIGHTDLSNRNKGGRPKGSFAQPGPERVQASVELVIIAASKKYRKGGSDKALSDLSRLVEAYSSILKQSGGTAQSPEDCFINGRRGAYEEMSKTATTRDLFEDGDGLPPMEIPSIEEDEEDRIRSEYEKEGPDFFVVDQGDLSDLIEEE